MYITWLLQQVDTAQVKQRSVIAGIVGITTVFTDAEHRLLCLPAFLRTIPITVGNAVNSDIIHVKPSSDVTIGV